MKNKIIISGLLILGLSISMHASEEITGFYGMEVGGTKLDDKDNLDIDYNDVNIRLTVGARQKKAWAEGRIKAFAQYAKGELEDTNKNKIDADSVEAGIGYDILFGYKEIRPLLSIDLFVGNTDFENNGNEGYTGYGAYTGLAYSIDEDMELTAKIGYKRMNYNDTDTSYDGVDFKIGLNFFF